jgi:cystathionine gamma-lyase
MDDPPRGDSTRVIHAGIPSAAQGQPFLPGPVSAAPYHLAGAADASPYAYARDANPTWTHFEAAIGELEGGHAVVFSSGMAAMASVVLARLGPGDVAIAPVDGYPGIRILAADRLETAGVLVHLVPTETRAIVEAVQELSPAIVWVETPSNPLLDVCDLGAVAEAVHDVGGLVAVDNTLATPLGQLPLAHGADFSMLSGTKSLAGHSDLLLGCVTVRDPALAVGLRAWRSQVGATPGPFETWLAHRSLATLELRLSRQSDNALSLALLLEARDDVADVRHPGLRSHPHHEVADRQMSRFGALLGFTLPSAAAAQAFLERLELVAEATSFGGVHSTAERRARWNTDAVEPGFIRFSAGCENLEDLVTDVEAALDAAIR